MKFLKPFEKFTNEKYSDASFTYNKDEDDYNYKWNEHIVKILNNEFGEKIQGKSADWGGLTLWPLQGDEFYGYFIVLDDENNLCYIKRTLYEDDENTTDHDYICVEEGDDITELVDMAKKQYIQNKYKI